MKNRKNIFIQFIAAVCSLFVSSACILFVPAVYSRSTVTLICSAVFWMSLIIGYILIFIIHRKDNQKKIRRRVAIITFFRNPPAKVADVAFIVSIVAVFTIGVLKIQIGYLQYVLYFIMVFSFHMHTLFNSDTYRFIQSEVRREKG